MNKYLGEIDISFEVLKQLKQGLRENEVGSKLSRCYVWDIKNLPCTQREKMYAGDSRLMQCFSRLSTNSQARRVRDILNYF